MAWPTKQQRAAKNLEPSGFKLRCTKCTKLFLANTNQKTPVCPTCKEARKERD